MKHTLSLTAMSMGAIILCAFAFVAFAHSDRPLLSDNQIAELLQKESLTDLEYEAIGEWWMQKTFGDDHELHDDMMLDHMGEEFLDEMHIAMGKQFIEGGPVGMTPMVQMVGSGEFRSDSRMPVYMMSDEAFGWGMHIMPWYSAWGVLVWVILWGLAAVGAVVILKLLAASRTANQKEEKRGE